MEPKLEDLVAFAERLADAARAVTLRYFRRQVQVEHKADASPVTVADRETERALCGLIEAQYPDHGLFGEEFGRNGSTAAYCWVIDPIDGTKSFISGVPTFGTLIALLRDDHPLLGVIEMPALAERWTGVQGQPTRFNGSPCRTSGCEDLAGAALFATTVDMFQGANGDRFAMLSQRVRMRRFGADCYAYGLLAAGFIDLVVEAAMAPYDYMALVPVVAGAGGVITDWAGKPLGLESDGRVVAAATPALHEQALTVLA